MSPRIPATLFLVLSGASFAEVRAPDDVKQEAALAVAIDGPPPPVAPEVVSRDEWGRVTLRAVRLDEPLELDGRLEESLYRRVPAIESFLQQEPHEGEPVTEETDVWFFFDDDNVYIAARCWDDEPERIVANELRRDSRDISRNDNFAVVLDTFYDRRNGYLFETNPLGALYDAQVTDERNVNSDWNTVWDVRTARFANGWTVEIEIPFKSLRYKEGQRQIWGVNFRRVVRSKNEWSYLTPIPAAYREGGLTRLSRAATIVGIEPPPGSRNLEVKPYATAGVRTDLAADEPYRNDVESDVGLDVKYGLTKSLVADFTVHTDFAQVEADDEQVNLTRFGLFFPEKREFFLEGQGIFAFGGGTGRRGGGPQDAPIVFFSRRIGLEEEVEVPIRAGARLTGRAGAYTLGLLDIQTGAAAGAQIEPTHFSVVRLKRDVLRRSNVGLIATHRSRSIEGPGSSSVLGVDAGFSFFENLDVATYYARSRTEGRDGNDQSYLAQVSYGGDRFGFNVSRLTVGEDFNPEVGFVRRDDIVKSSGRLRYSPRPKRIASVRQFTYSAQIDYFENGRGEVETKELELEFRTEFERGDSMEVGYSRNFEYLFAEFEVATGVVLPVGGYRFDRIRVNYRLGPQRRVSGFMSASSGGFFSGSRTEVSYFGRVEVTPQFSIEPDVSRNWVELGEGDFTTTLLRLRSTYALSARSFFGGLVQYNTSNDSFSMNFRYRWEYRPGSDFYVVYSDGRDVVGAGFPELESQSLVVKFTRLFRF